MSKEHITVTYRVGAMFSL